MNDAQGTNCQVTASNTLERTTLVSILKHGGLPSLYDGWGAVLCRNIPHYVIKFYTYESLKQLFLSTTQSTQPNTFHTVIRYGWAGLLRKYVVEPAHIWWPGTLVQVSLFRTLHEKDDRRMSRANFFLIALVSSLAWQLVPGYVFKTLMSISWVCWVFSKSVTAQQLGSGMHGLGYGAFTLDWSVVASFLYSPLICPFFAIVNVFIGYVLIIYITIPVAYWGLNVYNAKTFPIL